MRLRAFVLVTTAAAIVGFTNIVDVRAAPSEILSPSAETTSSPKPPPPPTDVPSILEVKPPVLCVDCDQPFDTATHERLLTELAGNPYLSQLRKALYLQDTYHQFESKAHFDNCDFDGAAAYITELLAETGRHVEGAKSAKSAGDKASAHKAVLSAFFSLGQALHGTQDFFAHTNYVELHTPKAKEVTDIPLLFPWRPEGRTRVKELQRSGLISGFVFWGFPQQCPNGTVSHGSLAKDKADTDSGKVRVPHLQNVSQYKIAAYLAREASVQLLVDAFRRWPLLKELNGDAVALDVFVDRRGIDTR